MSEIIILDGSEVKLNENKSGKLTIIAGESASIPLSLLPAFKKRDVTVKTVKDIEDSCEIAFCLGQIFKPGDVLITSRPEFARFKEYAEVKPVKTRVRAETSTKRTRKPKEAPEQREAEGAMPKPIMPHPSEAEEKKDVKEKKPKKTETAEEKTEQTESKNADMPDSIEAIPTDEGYTEFVTFLKGFSLSDDYCSAAKELYRLSLDTTSLKILAQTALKGLPEEAAESIEGKIKEIKKIA